MSVRTGPLDTGVPVRSILHLSDRLDVPRANRECAQVLHSLLWHLLRACPWVTLGCRTSCWVAWSNCCSRDRLVSAATGVTQSGSHRPARLFLLKNAASPSPSGSCGFSGGWADVPPVVRHARTSNLWDEWPCKTACALGCLSFCPNVTTSAFPSWHVLFGVTSSAPVLPSTLSSVSVLVPRIPPVPVGRRIWRLLGSHLQLTASCAIKSERLTSTKRLSQAHSAPWIDAPQPLRNGGAHFLATSGEWTRRHSCEWVTWKWQHNSTSATHTQSVEPIAWQVAMSARPESACLQELANREN